LPRHFKNGKDTSKNPEAAPGDQSAAPDEQKGGAKGEKGAKSDNGKKKEEKDVQLDRAIDILKHWNTFKLQLAKGETHEAGADSVTKPQ